MIDFWFGRAKLRVSFRQMSRYVSIRTGKPARAM
jgi:hypothetical protein